MPASTIHLPAIREARGARYFKVFGDVKRFEKLESWFGPLPTPRSLGVGKGSLPWPILPPRARCRLNACGQAQTD